MTQKPRKEDYRMYPPKIPVSIWCKFWIHLEARKSVSILRPELARVQFIRISDVN